MKPVKKKIELSSKGGVGALHGTPTERPLPNGKTLKQAIQEHIESKVLEGRIKELEMLPIMRKALHTPQKDLDIILVDTVNNRIKQLKRIEELTKQSEKSDE